MGQNCVWHDLEQIIVCIKDSNLSNEANKILLKNEILKSYLALLDLAKCPHNLNNTIMTNQRAEKLLNLAITFQNKSVN